jgi:molybdenum cofactor cytidylyltransferase
MPLVQHDIALTLANALGDAYAALPRHDGKPGHPVLLSRRAFADIAALGGDKGAGPLLRARGDVVYCDVADAGVLLDIDRPEDLDRITRSR